MTIKSDTGISGISTTEKDEKIELTEKQSEMLQSSAFELLWYGSRAGGKSFATYFAPLYYIQYADFTGLILRTSFTDLNDYLLKAKAFYEPFGATVTFGGNPKIKFPSGATLFVSYMKDASSLEKQKGKNLQLIIFEELTQLPSEELYSQLLATLRTSNPNLHPQMIATTNPDGVGARWVYERWDIGNEAKRDIMWETDKKITRQAIKSGVVDNPYIIKNNPNYYNLLKSYKGNLYKQWFLGEFVFTADKSQYYHQWLLEAEKENRINDFFIDPTLAVNTAHDIGINDSWSIVFFQQFGHGTNAEIRIINYYTNNNEGVQHYINILHDFRTKYNINYGIHYGPHDVAVRELSTGVSRQQTFAKMGLHMQLAPNESIQEGINAVRQVLPRCYFHKSNCSALVESLKIYRKVFNEKTQNYGNVPFHGPESHAADAFRYFALTVRPNMNQPQSSGQMHLGFSQ